MRAIKKRLQRLEDRLSPESDPEVHRIVNAIYQRRRRRLEAEGVPIEDLPLPPVVRPGPYLSIAETIRLRRNQLLAAERLARVDVR